MGIMLSLDEDHGEAIRGFGRLKGQSFKEPFLVQPQACGPMAGMDLLRLNQLVDQLELGLFLAAQTPQQQTP